MSSSFDWDRYERKQPSEEASEEEVVQEKTPDATFDWAKYEKEEGPKGLFKYGKDSNFEKNLKEGALKAAKVPGRAILRATEARGGFVGDIMGMGKDLIASGTEKLTGIPAEKTSKVLKAVAPGPPTSEKLRGINDRIFGDMSKSGGQLQNAADEFIEDLSVFLSPKDTIKKAGIKAGTALVANLGKEFLPADQKGGRAAAKTGVFLLSALLEKGRVKPFWKKSYAAANKAAKGERFGTSKFVPALEDFSKNRLQKGGPTAGKSKVKTFWEDVIKKARRGDLEVDELTQIKHDINTNRSSLYAARDMGKPERRQTKALWDELANVVEDQIQRYGKTNPEFLKNWNNAQSAFSGFYQSKRVGTWVRNLIPGARKLGKYPHLGLLIAEKFLMPSALAKTGAVYGGLKAAEIATRFLQNPTIRKLYIDAIKAAGKESKGVFIRNMAKIAQVAEKEDPALVEKIQKSNNS